MPDVQVTSLWCKPHNVFETVEVFMAERGVSSARFIAPNNIGSSSWLQDGSYEEFRRGYEYAKSQTRAIPVLAAVTPEDLYCAWSAINRGARVEASDEPEPAP